MSQAQPIAGVAPEQGAPPAADALRNVARIRVADVRGRPEPSDDPQDAETLRGPGLATGRRRVMRRRMTALRRAEDER